MLSRFSKIQNLKITSVSFSSVAEIGDSQFINGLTRALAVQREAEVFYNFEGDYSLFPIFREPIPIPPIEEEILVQKNNLSPCIQVSQIKITAVSAASVIHIGNSNHINMESRVKHIRQIFDED